MIFEKMEEITEKVSASEYLKELNNKIFNGLDSIDIYNDDKTAMYNVSTAENTFLIPDNYLDTSMIDVYIDEVEQKDYSIQEVAFVNCVVFNNMISNATVKIRCRNFKYGFLNFLKNNLSVG